MNMNELDVICAAAAKAEEDLKSAISKQRVANDEVAKVAAQRQTLALDEKAIVAQIDREKAAELKLEVATRLVDQADGVLADANAKLQRAKWQFQHDDLNARNAALAAKFKTDYLAHASAIVALFEELRELQLETVGFGQATWRGPFKDEAKIQHVTSLTGLRHFEEAYLPGFSSPLWPTPRPRPPQLAAVQAVEDSLNRAIG